MLSFGDTVGKETLEGEPTQGGRGEERLLALQSPRPFLWGQSFAKGTTHVLSCEGAHINPVRAQACNQLQNTSGTYLLHKTNMHHHRAGCPRPQWLKALWLFFFEISCFHSENSAPLVWVSLYEYIFLGWSLGSPMGNKHWAGECLKSCLMLSGHLIL